MGEPESEVRREGEGVQQAIFATGSADFDDAPGCRSEIGDVALREQEWSGFRAAARGESHEDGPKLGFKFAADLFAAMHQRAKDCTGTMRKHFLVRNQNEIFESLRTFCGVEEIGLGGEGNMSQVFERMDGVRREAEVAEHLPIMGRERQDNVAEIVP